MVRTLYDPSLDAAQALLWSKEVVEVLSLPDSQIGSKQRSMIGQRAIVKKRNAEGYLLLQYGPVTAWARPTDVEAVVLP